MSSLGTLNTDTRDTLTSSVSQENQADFSAAAFVLHAEAPTYLLVKDLAEADLTRLEAGLNKKPQTVRIFSLNSQDAEFQSFQEAVIPAFRLLDWDLYDVRREEMQLIQEACSTLSGNIKELLHAYYRGEIGQEKIIPLFENIPTEKYKQLLTIRPYRKKACSLFKASQIADSNEWFVELEEAQQITQRVENNDYRSMARNYKTMPECVIEQAKFKQIIANIIHMVKEAEPEMRSLRITAWMVSCCVWPGMPSTNSPEGIHQDGADYIVSALVMERNNIAGGISRIFGNNKEEALLSARLNLGDGLFQPDAGSSLWHDVTPIHVVDDNQAFGVRSLFGFDLHVERNI